jgi:hypothetical protein
MGKKAFPKQEINAGQFKHLLAIFGSELVEGALRFE